MRGPLDRCPVCGSPELTRHMETGGLALDRCGRCGTVFQNPLPVPEESAGHYVQYRRMGGRRFVSVVEGLIGISRMKRAVKVARLASPGRILDIGCGRGWMLKRLVSTGWDCYGVELPGRGPGDAPFKLHEGDLMGAGYEADFFDVVTMWHVLEHLHNPLETMAEIHRVLKPGGAVLIEVPNAGGLQSALFGRRWFHLDLPRHIFHFGRGQLVHLLRISGFRPLRWSNFSLEFSPFGVLQSFLNLFTSRPNLLYDTLRGVRRRYDQALAGTLVFPFALIFSIFESALSRGATLEVVAVKEALESGPETEQ